MGAYNADRISCALTLRSSLVDISMHSLYCYADVGPTWSDWAGAKHGTMDGFGLSTLGSLIAPWPPLIEPSFRVDRCEIAGG